jgi:hypothetical protein
MASDSWLGGFGGSLVFGAVVFSTRPAAAPLEINDGKLFAIFALKRLAARDRQIAGRNLGVRESGVTALFLALKL